MKVIFFLVVLREQMLCVSLLYVFLMKLLSTLEKVFSDRVAESKTFAGEVVEETENKNVVESESETFAYGE